MAEFYPVELKPCPFCGSNNVRLNYPFYYSNELCHRPGGRSMEQEG